MENSNCNNFFFFLKLYVIIGSFCWQWAAGDGRGVAVAVGFLRKLQLTSKEWEKNGPGKERKSPSREISHVYINFITENSWTRLVDRKKESLAGTECKRARILTGSQG